MARPCSSRCSPPLSYWPLSSMHRIAQGATDLQIVHNNAGNGDMDRGVVSYAAR